MFCPRCGAENELEQGYCRRCGLTLTSIRLGLEGQVDGGTTALKRAQKPLTIGVVALCVFFLVLLSTFLTGGVVGFSNSLSAIFLLALIIPFLVFAAAQVRRANVLLRSRYEREAAPLPEAGQYPDTLQPHSPSQLSATEDTTRKLDAQH